MKIHNTLYPLCLLALLATAGTPSARAGSEPSEPDTAFRLKDTLEEWTSADGRVLEAEFVRATADTVTLKRRDGRVFTLPLSRLSPECRARALARVSPR